MMEHKYWVEEPCVLFQSMSLFPKKEMTKQEKLNSLTRLVLLITVVLYLIGSKHWFVFMVASLLILTMVNYAGNCNGSENFTITPTYMSNDLQQTVTAPLFAEEWQIPPPAYDLYTNSDDCCNIEYFDEPLQPQSYPYGQYLTRTNILPSDEYYTHTSDGGARTAREYVNSSFLRNDLAFRDNMTRVYKKKLERRFRHNCQDTFSSYSSY